MTEHALYEVQWSQSAHDDIRAIFDYVADQASVLDADRLCERLLNATSHLSEFPRLYAVAPEWGEGVRRISLEGHRVLYEVDDQARRVRVLAVVGGRRNPVVFRRPFPLS